MSEEICAKLLTVPHVFVNDAEVSEGFTISNHMVMFDSAPAKDAVVRIYRNTPTTRLVSWQMQVS